MDKLQPVKTETIETYQIECPHGCVEPLYLIVTLRKGTYDFIATPIKFEVTHRSVNE
jgi:hypothetical protein